MAPQPEKNQMRDLEVDFGIALYLGVVILMMFMLQA